MMMYTIPHRSVQPIQQSSSNTFSLVNYHTTKLGLINKQTEPKQQEQQQGKRYQIEESTIIYFYNTVFMVHNI